MSKPLVVLTAPFLELVAPAIEAQGCEVGRGWALPDADRARVRALVAAGEFKLEPAYLETLPNLGLIAVVGVGYDGVDVDWCRARGIAVTAAPAGINAAGVADHALGLMLAGWRDLLPGHAAVLSGDWSNSGRSVLRPGLTNKQAGIVGLGAIGEAVARRCEAFGMRVSWWGPNPKLANWPRAASLVDLAQASDVLFVCAKPTPQNKGLISAEVIAALGSGGMLVNVARGSLVDEDALIAALNSGALARAGLDVFAEEPSPAGRWDGVPNCVLSPHAAGATQETGMQMVAVAMENVSAFLAGRPLLTPVSHP